MIKFAFLVNGDGKMEDLYAFPIITGYCTRSSNLSVFPPKSIHSSPSFIELQNHCPHNYIILKIIHNVRNHNYHGNIVGDF